MKTFNGILLLTIIVVACGPDRTAIQKEKHEEVMAVHDEVMPKMGTIEKLKKQFQSRADSLLQVDSTADVSEYLEMARQLEEANESMMVWMRAYDRPDENTSHEDALKFYEAEMEKVMEVRDKMLNSIERAQSR